MFNFAKENYQEHPNLNSLFGAMGAVARCIEKAAVPAVILSHLATTLAWPNEAWHLSDEISMTMRIRNLSPTPKSSRTRWSCLMWVMMTIVRSLTMNFGFIGKKGDDNDEGKDETS